VGRTVEDGESAGETVEDGESVGRMIGGTILLEGVATSMLARARCSLVVTERGVVGEITGCLR